MKKTFFIILSTLFYLLSTIYFLRSTVGVVHAQTATLSISPPVVEILIAPNKKATQTFNIKTQGDNVSIIPELHLVKPSDSTGHMSVDPNPVNLSTLPIIVNSPEHPLGQQLHIVGENLPLTLSFEAPNTDAPIDTYLALVVKAVSTSPFQSTSVATPSISALMLITLNPTGVMPINLEIKNFDLGAVHDSWLPLTPHPSLYNQSSIMIRPQGNYEILDPSGKTIFTLPLYPNLVLGNSSRNLQSTIKDLPSDLTWTPSWHDFGPYTVRLTIESQGGTKLTQIEKTIWLIPLRLGIITLTLITLVIILLTASRKHSKVKVV